jgi:hypothetical protein
VVNDHDGPRTQPSQSVSGPLAVTDTVTVTVIRRRPGPVVPGASHRPSNESEGRAAMGRPLARAAQRPGMHRSHEPRQLLITGIPGRHSEAQAGRAGSDHH